MSCRAVGKAVVVELAVLRASAESSGLRVPTHIINSVLTPCPWWSVCPRRAFGLRQKVGGNSETEAGLGGRPAGVGPVRGTLTLFGEVVGTSGKRAGLGGGAGGRSPVGEVVGTSGKRTGLGGGPGGVGPV